MWISDDLSGSWPVPGADPEPRVRAQTLNNMGPDHFLVVDAVSRGSARSSNARLFQLVEGSSASRFGRRVPVRVRGCLRRGMRHSRGTVDPCQPNLLSETWSEPAGTIHGGQTSFHPTPNCAALQRDFLSVLSNSAASRNVCCALLLRSSHGATGKAWPSR